jgi:hypothetical protein
MFVDTLKALLEKFYNVIRENKYFTEILGVIYMREYLRGKRGNCSSDSTTYRTL